MKQKKSQLFSETFKYILIGLFSVIILFIGFRAFTMINERSCLSEMQDFEAELKNFGKELRFGTKEMKSYMVPCRAKNIYLFDLTKKIDLEQFNKIPVMKDSLKTSGNHNLFLVRDDKFIDSFYAGSLEIENPYYLCLLAQNGKIMFFAEGSASAAKITLPAEQARC